MTTNPTLAIAFAVLLAREPAVQTQTTAGPAQTQSSSTQPTDDAQRLTNGEITKIDAKKKILTVTTTNDSSPASSQPQNTGRRNGGGGMGRPFPGGGGGGRRAPTSSSKDQGKPFKVTITDETAIKDGENTISFGLLRVGDRISIQGLPKGSGADLKATQITVTR